MVHVMEHRVCWHETDKAGIVHHANFFFWFEQAEIELFRQSGKSRMQLAKESATAHPRISVRCDFFSPAQEDDVLEVRTEVLNVSEKTYHLRHEVHRPADGAHLATGEVVICCVKEKEDGTFRSHPLPEEMAAALKKYRVPREEGPS